MAQLPNPFLNSAVINPRTAGSAVASSDLQPRATAAPFAEPSMTNGGEPGTPASAPPKNPDAGVLDATDCIHEIFHWVRKLMRGHQGFVLDEPAFLADVEEEPLFIRSGDHLRRWEA